MSLHVHNAFCEVHSISKLIKDTEHVYDSWIPLLNASVQWPLCSEWPYTVNSNGVIPDCINLRMFLCICLLKYYGDIIIGTFALSSVSCLDILSFFLDCLMTYCIKLNDGEQLSGFASKLPLLTNSIMHWKICANNAIV